MQNKYKEAGGGPARGLANDLVGFLSQGLNTGTFGAGNAMGVDSYNASTGIAGVLNDILSGGAGQIGGSMQDMITKNNERQVADTRARFGAQGGTAFGTGAQYAEGVQKAELAPQLTSAIGQLQIQTLLPLLQLITGLADKGISQRQGYIQPSGLTSTIGAIAPFAGLLPSLMGTGGAASVAGGITPPASIPYIGIDNPRINMSSSQIPSIMPSISSYGIH